MDNINDFQRNISPIDALTPEEEAIEELQDEVAILQSDSSTLQSNVSTLQADVSSLDVRMDEREKEQPKFVTAVSKQFLYVKWKELTEADPIGNYDGTGEINKPFQDVWQAVEMVNKGHVDLRISILAPTPEGISYHFNCPNDSTIPEKYRVDTHDVFQCFQAHIYGPKINGERHYSNCKVLFKSVSADAIKFYNCAIDLVGMTIAPETPQKLSVEESKFYTRSCDMRGFTALSLAMTRAWLTQRTVISKGEFILGSNVNVQDDIWVTNQEDDHGFQVWSGSTLSFTKGTIKEEGVTNNFIRYYGVNNRTNSFFDLKNSTLCFDKVGLYHITNTASTDAYAMGVSAVNSTVFCPKASSSASVAITDMYDRLASQMNMFSSTAHFTRSQLITASSGL